MTALSQDLLLAWKKSVQTWAAEGSINRAARDALALQGEQPLLDQLISQWSKSDFSGLPPIELLDEEAMPGAAGAYAVSTGTIYLNRGWLSGARNEQIHAVLTEELGHHLDFQFNEIDTSGDEGELFRRIIEGEVFNPEKMDELRSESDSIILTLANGDKVWAEAINISGSEGRDTLTGTDSEDSLNGRGGNDSIDGAGGNDLLEGGIGDDSITGGNGNDLIFTGYGNDSIYAGTGDDIVAVGVDKNQPDYQTEYTKI